jgi:hypothetical protein
MSSTASGNTHWGASAAGSTADLNKFFAQRPPRMLQPTMKRRMKATSNLTIGETTSMPQNPWATPAGCYIRTDGSIVYVSSAHQLHTDRNQAATVNDSTECLAGGGAAHQVGKSWKGN